MIFSKDYHTSPEALLALGGVIRASCPCLCYGFLYKRLRWVSFQLQAHCEQQMWSVTPSPCQVNTQIEGWGKRNMCCSQTKGHTALSKEEVSKHPSKSWKKLNAQYRSWNDNILDVRKPLIMDIRIYSQGILQFHKGKAVSLYFLLLYPELQNGMWHRVAA